MAHVPNFTTTITPLSFRPCAGTRGGVGGRHHQPVTAWWWNRRRVECNEIQGYLFSPPVPTAEIIQLLGREFVEPTVKPTTDCQRKEK